MWFHQEFKHRDSPDLEARLAANVIHYFVSALEGTWPAARRSVLCSSPSWWEAPGRSLWAHFWIDFLSACGYKEAPGDKLFAVNPSRPDKTANPASWVSTSEFLMIVNHLLTQNGNDHTAGHPWSQPDRCGVWILAPSLYLFSVKIWSSNLLP